MFIPFSKYQGAGNDFVLIDNRESNFLFDHADIVARVCDRRFGVGADGVLLLESSSIADYKMRIFNADGSEPAMCGNGTRCLIDFLHRLDDRESYQIEIAGRVLKCKWQRDKITVNLGKPMITHWPINLSLSIGDTPVYILNTGVPHAVLFVENLFHIPFLQLSKEIRFHPAFAPQGANVNFAKVLSQNAILLRTYERGVEDETLACGTGAAATAWVAKHLYDLHEPVVIKTRCSLEVDTTVRDSMTFSFPANILEEREIEMIGSASFIFSGKIDLKINSVV